MADFHQVWPCRGVDENIPTRGTGMMVPKGDSNCVMLTDGADFDFPGTADVKVDELTDARSHPTWVELLPLRFPSDQLKTRAIRVFNLTGISAGLDKVVGATNEKTREVAKLKVSVFEKMTITVSIRGVQVVDRGVKINVFDDSVPPQDLVDVMNLIWEAQANIVFELASTDPVVIDGFNPAGKAGNKGTLELFAKKKDPTAALTMFRVRQAYDDGSPVWGATSPELGISLISDKRLVNTFAHEAGHFLGSRNEQGTYMGMHYTHPERGQDLLMAEGGPGERITYSSISNFNKGYRRVNRSAVVGIKIGG